jgi:glycosyltransferase involved in cell wall biosynthesis
MNAPIPVTVMIFTLNEEIHLPSCLAALDWCDDIIVVDSFSTDRTEAICRERGVRFFQHGFEGFGSQRNWALDHTEPRYPWILILDADERVTKELARELGEKALNSPRGVGAYRVRRRVYLWGRWLKYSSLYPTWMVRFIHRDRVRYLNRGHAETQEVHGQIDDLEYDLIDENLKGIDEWFERQNRYSTKDAFHELEQARNAPPWSQLVTGDALERRAALKALAARLPARGLLYFLYAYIWRRGFLDGRDGLVFCVMRAMYQTMVAVKKYDARRNRALARRDGAESFH